MKLFPLLLLSLFIISLGCVGPSPEDSSTNSNEYIVAAKDMSYTTDCSCDFQHKEIVDKFAFDLLRTFDKSDNLLLSPVSIISAFSLVQLGTPVDSQSYKQLYSVFGDPKEGASLRCCLNDFYDDYIVKSANSIWFDEGLMVNKSYLDLVSAYKTEIKVDDLQSQPFVDRVNRWVSRNTHGKIPSILNGPLSDKSKFVVINAVYFKGKWDFDIDKQRTSLGNFTDLEGNTHKTYFMKVYEYFLYSEDDKFKMVYLPYKGGDVGMYLILPKSYENGMPELTYEEFHKLQQSGDYPDGRVDLIFPKFEFKSPQYSLNMYLGSLGINLHEIDPSLISNTKLPLGAVIHRTYISVDEEGTEAAAVTGVGSVPIVEYIPKEFHADHPFYYVIYHKDYGVLFIGEYLYPKDDVYMAYAPE